MIIHRGRLGTVVQTPAKLNLFFEVLEKRRDGYHEIETLMAPVDLFDTLYFEEDFSGQVKLDCRRVAGPVSGTGSDPRDRIGRDGPRRRCRWAPRTWRFGRSSCFASEPRRAPWRGDAVGETNPIAAGLGGGSSDAAAAWSRRTKRGASAGRELAWPRWPRSWAATCRSSSATARPSVGVAGSGSSRSPAWACCTSSWSARRPRWPRPTCTASASRPRGLGPWRPCWTRFGKAIGPEAGRLLFNRLETAAKTLCPWIEKLEDVLRREDCLGHLMSGSGTCCFGLCRHARHARHVARRLQATGVGTVYRVRGSR